MPAHFESLDKLVRQDPALRFRTDDLGVVTHLRGRLTEPAADSVDRDPRGLGVAFLQEHDDLFGDVDPVTMVTLEAGPDPSGGGSAILEQRHYGHRVLGGSVRFHVNEDGALDTVSNRLFPDLAKVPHKPKVDAAAALRTLHQAVHSRTAPTIEPELVVLRHEGSPYLAWEIRLATDRHQHGDWNEPTQWVGYVDSDSGKLLSHYNNIQTAGPVVASGTGYYGGAGTLNAWFTDATYQLRDTSRTGAGGPEIRTIDEDGASPSEDADGIWNTLSTSPRDANQGAEVDAHRFTGAVVDYFRTVHGRVSFDGAGGAHTNVVHLGTDYSNGYWDGAQVNLGDGTGAAPGDDYECSDDWLAHEWTHAYTQHTCGLTYQNESGALNEAFSDIFAAFITGDWLVFEDTWLKASAPAWRNMADPTNGGQWNVADPINSVIAGHQPSHYSVRYTGTWDNGGVHVNSGIINNLFYLLTIGGTHTVSGVSVVGIGQSAAELMLWRCMTVNLVGQPNATFLQFREAMLDACLDLFPTDLSKLAQVKAAFNAVGIGPDTYVRDTTDDTGAEPNPAGILCMSPDIINRTASTANPAVDFADLTNGGFAQNVEFGQDNHVYIRLQNRGPQSGDALVRVYFSPAAAFSTPASWIYIGALTATGVASGALRVLGPLTFPKAQIPAPGHYCMIAVASSSLDPAPNTGLISTVPMFVDYVRGTNNIAWRNLDVVNNVAPGTAGHFDVIIRGLGPDREHFAVRIDDAAFVPGARLRVRGPAKALRGAIPQAMRLVAVEGEEAIFEVLDGRGRQRQFRFQGLDKLEAPVLRDTWRLARSHRETPGLLAGDLLRAILQPRLRPGFDRLTVEEDFRLRVEYLLPERAAGAEAERPPPRNGHILAVRQYWRDEPLGAASIRLNTAAR